MRSAENTIAIPSGSVESFPGAAAGRGELLELRPDGVLPGAELAGAVLLGAALLDVVPAGALLPPVPLRLGPDAGPEPLPLGAAGPDPLGCAELEPPGPDGADVGGVLVGGAVGGVLQDVLPEHGGGGG